MYSAVELTRHLHTVHNTPLQKWLEEWYPQVDGAVALTVLEMLGLPEDTLLSEVSGRAVCTCPTFKAGSTFSELVRSRFGVRCCT